jgi:hypothetical protein
MKKTHYYNRQSFDNREGACSKDVWDIYNLLPENTFFTLCFVERYSGTKLELIEFPKCGNLLDEKSVQDYTQQMKNAFRRWGYNEYPELQLVWRKGFGNSVEIYVLLDNTKENKRKESKV